MSKDMNNGHADRFKFRVWNDMQKCYSMDDHYISEDGFMNTVGDYVLEQCTGLKDKNGKLIYEGDIIGGVFGGYIGWCDKEKSFEIFAPEYGCLSCSGDVVWAEVIEDDGKLEIIGNIHGNADLLE